MLVLPLDNGKGRFRCKFVFLETFVPWKSSNRRVATLLRGGGDHGGEEIAGERRGNDDEEGVEILSPPMEEGRV